MHKVPADWTPEEPNDVEISIEPIGVEGAYPWRPVRIGLDRNQTWLLDVEDKRLIITIAWEPDTDPLLVAEAVAVVRSMRPGPDEDGDGWRVVFELQEGWDSG